MEDELGPLVGMQLAVSAILYGSAEQREQAERDPRVQAYWACRRFAERQAREKAIKSAASSTATDKRS